MLAEFFHVNRESVYCPNGLIFVILIGNHLYSKEVSTLKGLCIVLQMSSVKYN